MAPSKQVTLALAAFMDSAERGALVQPRDDVRTIVGRFLSVCHDDLGIPPRKLDGEHTRVAIAKVLPGKFKRGEALAEATPDVLRAYLAHLELSEVLANSFELKQGFEDSIDEFLKAVRDGAHAPAPQRAAAPFEHRASKTGRNDPCFCGSGKKFKKCCGKG